MESKKYYPQAEDDAEATLVEPRFDEEAKESARPVVPLSRVTRADLYAAGPAHLTARRARSPWQSPLVIILAVVALAAVVTAAALYRGTRATAPSAAPQIVNETTVESEPETVVSAPEPAREQSTAAQARENGTAAPAPPPRESEARAATPEREEPERSWHKNEERRDRDEEKSAERARKDEKKEARREEKEAERTAEKRGGPEKREETRPRLVGIYVEGRKKP